MVKAVANYVHRQGRTLLQFLDDWNCLSTSCAAARTNTKWLLQITPGLGFLVNYKKSNLIPSQRFEFIGILLDLVQARAWPAPHRREGLLRIIKTFSAAPLPAARLWQVLLGHLASLSQLVPRGRLHTRPIQLCLRQQWSPLRDPPHVLVAPDAETLESVPAHLDAGVSLRPLPTPLRLYTDASLSGWGAHRLEHQARGVWSPTPRHINWLELKAVILALQQFLPHVQNRHIIAMTDNMTVVAHINKQGGTHSRELFNLTKVLLLWADSHHITLSACHVPGHLNVLADMLSHPDLHPAVARQLWKTWGTPHVDLFATSLNNKLSVYVSNLPDPQAWEEDVLSLNWTCLWAYAFPPFPLLPDVIAKARREPGELILVAPMWPTRTWFPDLLDLLVDHPRSLPQRPDLLRQPHQGPTHGNLEALNLHAWHLSGTPSAREAFLRQCPAVSSSHIDQAPDPATTLGGQHRWIGAVNGAWIRSTPLPPS